MSTDKETGGPAFPHVIEGGADSRWSPSFEAGLSIRDYFAAKAMQGFAHDYHPEIDAGRIAAVAYRVADAMIKARAL